MEKIIVYGLGLMYKKYKKFLEDNYDVVAYSDKKGMVGSIYPSEIKNITYDKILVTSSKNFLDIQEELVRSYHVKKEKILSINDIILPPLNEETRDLWVKEKLLTQLSHL